MLTRAVTDGVMQLSLEDREELAAFLIDSLRDDAQDAEEELVLDLAEDDDDLDETEREESPASEVRAGARRQ